MQGGLSNIFLWVVDLIGPGCLFSRPVVFGNTPLRHARARAPNRVLGKGWVGSGAGLVWSDVQG